MSHPQLFMRRGEERRVQVGHLWVYSNEIDTKKSRLKEFQPGALATLCRYDGKTLGTVYVNPASLICARVIGRQSGLQMDTDFFRQRLGQALSLREQLFAEPCYRLCHSEGDLLPGLIVDRYGDYLVAQINTVGMAAAEAAILEALQDLLNPKGILLRNDTSSQELEGLPQEIRLAAGEMPEKLELQEGPARFIADPWKGQKTGWFYDQRANRDHWDSWLKDQSVLDLFSYAGGWTVRSALAGACEVTAVDISASAIAAVEENAALNGVAEKVSTIEGDVFEVLKDMRASGRQFDVVVLDPPAFIKRKKDMEEGSNAYLRANKLAMEVLKPGGLLVSCSCSYHMAEDKLQRTILKASGQLRRSMQILARGQQGPDHPVHPAIPESMYLKAFYCRVL